MFFQLLDNLLGIHANAKMKLDGDHVLRVQTPPRKSYNPFDSDDEIEASDGYLKGSFNGYDIESFETNDNSLTFHLNNRDLSWEEEILSHSQILSQTVLTDLNGEEVLFRTDTELFTDKTVTDCELPEMMDYYKENLYHSVKDIGVDEGMPVHDKVSIKRRDDHAEIDGDEHREFPYMEGLKSRADSDSEKDTFSQSWSNDSLKESGMDREASQAQQIDDQVDFDETGKVNGLTQYSDKEQLTSSEASTGDVVESDCGLFSTRDLQLNKEDGESYPNLVKEDNQVSEDRTHESSLVPLIVNGAKASAESGESRYREATTSQSSELPASQEAYETGDSLSYNSKVVSGSVILDFNYSTPEAEGMVGKNEDAENKGEEEKDEEENSQHNETFEKPPEAQSMSRHDEGSSASIFNCRADNLFLGETSFSAAIPCPASITYTRAHGHTGSISLRSESSAGSTRSFAFPVLQAEWNSSPVRMAKPDQGNFRRRRGWVHSLVCC